LRIGIFGGTFNPPHIGHVKAANAAAGLLDLDLLIVIPAGLPPHKGLPAGTPPAEDRFQMARLAFGDSLNTEVSDMELNTETPGYTVDTALKIKYDYPEADLFLLVGTDMYLTLESWKDSGTLLKTVTPAVFSRGAGDNARINDYSRRLLTSYGSNTEIVVNDVVEISSSELRELLPGREGVRYIADTTYAYIIKNRFYGAKPDWDWLRTRAHAMLDPKRIPHVAGCEEEAVRLAERWEVNPDNAREAAILHDITKRLSMEENLEILTEHGCNIDRYENAAEKLLHSQTGALLARSEFGVSETVAEAIRWHTTGKAKMTKLEKIIYLADYIEPNRNFDGVEALRKLSYIDLDKAMVMGLELSISDMLARGITPNRTTFNALDDLTG